MKTAAEPRVRVGKSCYLNVLPVDHALDCGAVAHNFDFTVGPPAELNARMAAGELDLSAVSSIEYARRSSQYLLVPDLAIGSRGPVQSVLLLSKRPIHTLGDQTILVSSQTHTSAALLRVLFREYLPLEPAYETGDASERIAFGDPPVALLAIGNEALALRNHPAYAFCWDLGEVWRTWTGLPFIFGVWVVRRAFATEHPAAAWAAARTLLESKAWGQERLPELIRLAAQQVSVPLAELDSYFRGLVYDLGEPEYAGLRCFYGHLAQTGEIAAPPTLECIGPPDSR